MAFLKKVATIRAHKDNSQVTEEPSSHSDAPLARLDTEMGAPTTTVRGAAAACCTGAETGVGCTV